MAVSSERSTNKSYKMAITQAKYIYHGCWSMIWVRCPYFIIFVMKKVTDIDLITFFQAQHGAFFINKGNLMAFFLIIYTYLQSKRALLRLVHICGTRNFAKKGALPVCCYTDEIQEHITMKSLIILKASY